MGKRHRSRTREQEPTEGLLVAKTETEESSGTVAQVWLRHPLDKELRKHAEAERRSLSATIRLAIEDKLRGTEQRQLVDQTPDQVARRRSRRPRLRDPADRGLRRAHAMIAAAFAQAFSTKPELSDLTIDQLKVYGDELTKDIDTRPIQIVSFEC
jgi:hypothetical protein